ncbi:hypothetical protein BTA51_04675 [Hahella sp. CCB-MM4]|nr:hypothetical protein BTA51_04675 [Hahella sp. CCB-MM4]
MGTRWHPVVLAGACLLWLILTGISTSSLAAEDPELEDEGDTGDTIEESADMSSYEMDYIPADSLDMPAPTLPPTDIYNEEWVRQRLAERAHQGAPEVKVERMFKKFTLREFTAGKRAIEWTKRQLSHPKAIFVRSGTVTAKDILEAVNNPGFFEEESPGVFILRLPLVVERTATLVLDGSEVKTLKLSQDRGAFMEVHGKMFTLGTEMIAWNEEAQTNAAYKSSKEFRPFLTTWGGSELYMVKTRVLSFGYNQSKSYGITVTHYSEDENSILKQGGPQAWIMDSDFEDIYYGFYCYEAEGLVVIRNTYHHNVIYGIDPHDYSSHLLIADNVVYGTKKKHGIIVSRSVNDSWIFNNKSYDNAISGFVLDRSSERNVIANNLAYRNGGDGYTVYESNDNLFWSNVAFDNRKHGMRARNSSDIRLYGNRLFRNGGFGILGHVADLSETDRDFVMDPYTMDMSLVIHGGRYAMNGRGPFHAEHPKSVVLYDLDMRFPSGSMGLQLYGLFKPYQSTLLEALIRDAKAVKLQQSEDSNPIESGTES